jgi:natural product precursor
MKLTKIKLNQLAEIEMNEREMCRLLGGGTPGCCQCSCAYADTGGSSTSANDGANNANGQTSDGSNPCCTPPPPPQKDCYCQPADGTKLSSTTMCGSGSLTVPTLCS